MVKFNVVAMKLFCEEDGLLYSMFNDLSKRNPNCTEENMLEVVFNSEVLEDSAMTREYKKFLKISNSMRKMK